MVGEAISTKILLVKGRAGLGNRMLSVMTGILYAKLTGRRLIIDWSDGMFSTDRTNAFHHFFRCPLTDPNDRIPEAGSVRPAIWEGRLQEDSLALERRYGNTNDPNSWKNFSIDLSHLDYPEDVLVLWTYNAPINELRPHFKGPFHFLQKATRSEILTNILREDLLLQPRIRERMEQFKAAVFRKKTVGVHVRYSDHRVYLWSILRCLNRMISRNCEMQIFLATDNIGITNFFQANYPNVVNTLHWYSAPGLPIHSSVRCPDRIARGIEALVDLYLLAECDHLIVDTSSSFSVVATLLTNLPRAEVMDVRRRGKRHRGIRKVLLWLHVKFKLFPLRLAILHKALIAEKMFYNSFDLIRLPFMNHESPRRD